MLSQSRCLQCKRAARASLRRRRPPQCCRALRSQTSLRAFVDLCIIEDPAPIDLSEKSLACRRARECSSCALRARKSTCPAAGPFSLLWSSASERGRQGLRSRADADRIFCANSLRPGVTLPISHRVRELLASAHGGAREACGRLEFLKPAINVRTLLNV